MSEPQLPPRPLPPRRPIDALRTWCAWVGAGRLLGGLVGGLVVLGVVTWLVRSGPPPTEQMLPVAEAAEPPATLPTSPPGEPTVGGAGGVADRTVVVHVAGAVAAPGVYELVEGDRVVDAVRAAGGDIADADLDGLNLAAVVTDGARVYVPRVGEIDPAFVSAGDGLEDAAPPVDINRATADDFDRLPGVGPATARAIVDDRDRNGPFASVDELERVPGIGPAKLDALRELVTT